MKGQVENLPKLGVQDKHTIVDRWIDQVWGREESLIRMDVMCKKTQ